MRLDHLLSKEVVCGGGFLAVDLARAVGGLGRLEGLLLRKGGWLLLLLLAMCGGGWGWLVAVFVGIGDTPAAA